jgi:hypothetical protein
MHSEAHAVRLYSAMHRTMRRQSATIAIIQIKKIRVQTATCVAGVGGLRRMAKWRNGKNPFSIRPTGIFLSPIRVDLRRKPSKMSADY